MTPIDRALAEQACIKLQTLYCVHADQGNVEGFTALFAPDGSIKVPEHPAFAGHDAIRASITALAATGIAMRHLAMNAVVHVESDDAASGLCYLVVFNSGAPADEHGWRPMDLPATVGQYDDAFVRISGQWLFRSRTLTRVFRRMDDPILAAARAAEG
jgi:hypothetical protein